MNRITIFLAGVLVIGAASIALSDPEAKITSAALVNEHKVSEGGGEMKQGDVQITSSDGKTEVITHDGKCMDPEVSRKGAVYWTHCSGMNGRGYPLDEKVFLRAADGKITELKGQSGYPVLRNSAFTADGSALIAMWGGYHGIPAFVKYDASNGKATARSSGIGDYNKLPAWAKAVAKGEDSLENSAQ